MELVVVRRMLGKCKEFVRSIQRYSIELKAVRILLGEWRGNR